MVNVLYAPDADDDLFGIVEYIAKDKPEAARQWLRKIRETCETIATHPEMGELRPGFGVAGARSYSIGNYVIFFVQPKTVLKCLVSSTAIETCQRSRS